FPPTMTKECSPGVVSPPVAATWIVLINQSNASGVPCGPGAVILVRLHGGVVASLLKPFQSPAKTILEIPTSCVSHKGAIIWAFHWLYNWFKEAKSPDRLCAKLLLSLMSVAKL